MRIENEPINDYAAEQYEMVRGSRMILFDYCKTISHDDLLREHASFGRGGSIRNLLVHVANVYEFWVGKNALNKNLAFTTYDSRQSISEIIDLFAGIDILMEEFARSMNRAGSKDISYEINGIKSATTPFRLFTHVITHEFHHKGQVLSISRHLGYTPVDTDIIR